MKIVFALALSASVLSNSLFAEESDYVFKAGHSSLQEWLLPDTPPHPADNAPTADRVALGKSLFFDPRLSGDGNMSCATCHNPLLGWSDGLPTAKGVKSKVLGRASPTIINTGYNSIQMWDGRKASLEDQAMGPMEATVEMNMDTEKLFRWLNQSEGYIEKFGKAYPGKAIDAGTVSKAIASYERTVVSNKSRFDDWVKGNAKAMNAREINGFKLFVGKANCSVCHSAPNFTDDGFHNIGLASWGDKEPDMGRYSERPLRLMKGAFKTPTLREISRTAPYFHDGSSATLASVVDQYDKGGSVKTNLSPNMKSLDLSSQDKKDLVAFMETLSSPYQVVGLPELPLQ
ncbi:MAG: cytochrome c peroxidase [Gammaproteobacteria bacterium]